MLPCPQVDVADSQPCVGTGGILAWQLTAHGKMFHSGIPHKAINPIELAMEALVHIQVGVDCCCMEHWKVSDMQDIA